MTGSDPDCPYVSVIVPVYNDPEGIRQCLEALGDQTYHDECFEVLVVDNGSTDHTRDVFQDFSVTSLVEDEVQGSYAARNEGIEHANGEVLAFTDADCTPDPTWIEAGVATLSQENADLAAGRVRFEFTDRRTAAEQIDASMNMRNDESVRDGVAKTANLFVRETVIDGIGPFPNHLISGGDVFWTGLATDAGFELVYAPNAVVSHPSRRLGELLRKQYRVGKNQVRIWRLDGKSVGKVLLTGLFRFPMKVGRFIFEKSDEGEEVGVETPSDRHLDGSVGIYLVAAVCILATNLGRISGLIGGRRIKR